MPSEKLRDDGVTDDEFDSCVRRAKREGKGNAYAYCNGMPNATALRSFAKGRKSEGVVPLSMALGVGNPIVEARRIRRLEDLLSEERLAGCERRWDQLTEDEQQDRRALIVKTVGMVVDARRNGNLGTIDRLLTDMTGGPLESGKRTRLHYMLKGLEEQPIYKILAAAWRAIARAAEAQPEDQDLDEPAILEDPAVEKHLDEIERVYHKFGRAA